MAEGAQTYILGGEPYAVITASPGETPGGIVVGVEYGGGVEADRGALAELLLMALEAVTGIEVDDATAEKYLSGYGDVPGANEGE